jgi:hypothetical protein
VRKRLEDLPGVFYLYKMTGAGQSMREFSMTCRRIIVYIEKMKADDGLREKGQAGSKLFDSRRQDVRGIKAQSKPQIKSRVDYIRDLALRQFFKIDAHYRLPSQAVYQHEWLSRWWCLLGRDT